MCVGLTGHTKELEWGRLAWSAPTHMAAHAWHRAREPQARLLPRRVARMPYVLYPSISCARHHKTRTSMSLRSSVSDGEGSGAVTAPRKTSFALQPLRMHRPVMSTTSTPSSSKPVPAPIAITMMIQSCEPVLGAALATGGGEPSVGSPGACGSTGKTSKD